MHLTYIASLNVKQNLIQVKRKTDISLSWNSAFLYKLLENRNLVVCNTDPHSRNANMVHLKKKSLLE